MAFYILVTSPVNRIPAREVLNHRLKRKFWPINELTVNREKIREGDKFVFYLAGIATKGQMAQCFVASASAVSQVISHKIPISEIGDDINPGYGIWLEDINYFPEPISIRDLLKKLSLIKLKTTKAWGGYLQGGCIPISEKDYNLIKLSSSK